MITEHKIYVSTVAGYIETLYIFVSSKKSTFTLIAPTLSAAVACYVYYRMESEEFCLLFYFCAPISKYLAA